MKNIKTLNIFVGYDPREAIAYHALCNSIIRHSTVPVAFHPLALNNMKKFYSDNNHTDGSNQFIYSRFLVPYLSNYEGWSLFVDGDMIVRGDIAELLEYTNDDSKAVYCVKHDYKTKMAEKYLGAKNENYPRKNWSSVILFNNEKCKKLTPEFVQQATGAELHRFYWTGDDSLIGELPIEWNWLSQEFGVNDDAKLVHYTLGTPSFLDFAKGEMADEWHREAVLTNYCLQPEHLVK
jgi:hypothetical protein